MTTSSTLQVAALLAALVEERMGIHYTPVDLPILADKARARSIDAGFTTLLDYYYFIRYDAGGDAELRELADLLVVGETYLFRELDALRAAVTSAIQPAVAKRGRARVWSAGCATGEEPFTLAMLLADAGLLDSVDIVATDLSTRSIGRAATGIIGRRSLRTLTPAAVNPSPPWARELAERWLTPLPDGSAQVSRRLVDTIAFRQDSLVKPTRTEGLAELDLVICRNVLIYFRDAMIASIVASLTERLRSGGRLLVGTAESLLRFGTALRCEEHAGAFFYVKA